MWSAGGLRGLLGAVKRRMLSLADRPSAFAAPLLPLETGAAEGIVEVGDELLSKNGAIWLVWYERSSRC